MKHYSDEHFRDDDEELREQYPDYFEDDMEDFDDEAEFQDIEGYERYLYNFVIEDEEARIEFTVRITPKGIDGKRYVDVLEAYDLVNNILLDNPRLVVTSKAIDDAIDLLIWSIENSEDLTEAEKWEYLSDLQ